MSVDIAAVVMAAGKSTRMKSALPKAVHPICGKPVTRYVIDACKAAGIDTIIVVIGHEAEAVKSTLGNDVSYAYQAQQLGTGHACREAMPSVHESAKDVLVLPGDTPLITPQTLSKLIATHCAEGNAATLLTAVLEDPASYGRVIRDASGAVLKIQEARDANPETLAIHEINTSIYCFRRNLLEAKLAELKSDNAQSEYYLTDVIELLNRDGERVGAVTASDARDTLGINNRAELAEVAAIVRARINKAHMLAGVTIVDPATTYIDIDVKIGPDTVIKPCSVIEGASVIGSGCEIGPFAHLTGVTISDGAKGVRSGE